MLAKANSIVLMRAILNLIGHHDRRVPSTTEVLMPPYYFLVPFTRCSAFAHIVINEPSNERFGVLKILLSSSHFLAFFLFFHQDSRAAFDSLPDSTPQEYIPA
jgi:hypothetical protein